MLDDHSGLGGCHSRILDRWTATQAAPKAPQRKRPCRSRALSVILTVRSLKCALASPDSGLVALACVPKILSQHTPTTKLSTAMARNPRASYLPLLPPSKNLATAIKEKVNGSGTQMNDCWVRRYSNSFPSSRSRAGIILYQYTATTKLNTASPKHASAR